MQLRGNPLNGHRGDCSCRSGSRRREYCAVGHAMSLRRSKRSLCPLRFCSPWILFSVRPFRRCPEKARSTAAFRCRHGGSDVGGHRRRNRPDARAHRRPAVTAVGLTGSSCVGDALPDRRRCRSNLSHHRCDSVCRAAVGFPIPAGDDRGAGYGSVYPSSSGSLSVRSSTRSPCMPPKHLLSRPPPCSMRC